MEKDNKKSEDFNIEDCIIVDRKYLESIFQPEDMANILRYSKEFQPEMVRAYETGWVENSIGGEDFEESLYEYVHEFELI